MVQLKPQLLTTRRQINLIPSSKLMKLTSYFNYQERDNSMDQVNVSKRWPELKAIEVKHRWICISNCSANYSDLIMMKRQ